MPALQQIYYSSTQLTSLIPAIDKLTSDIKKYLKPLNINFDKGVISLNKEIILLNNIFYDYPNASRTALKSIRLSISSNSIVGLVGASGMW